MNKKIVFICMLVLVMLSGCKRESDTEETGKTDDLVVHTMNDLVVDPDFDFSMMHDVEIKIVNKKMAHEFFDIYTDNPANGGTAIIINAYFDKDGVYLYTKRVSDIQSSLYIKSKNENMESKTIKIVNRKAYYNY